MPLLTAASLLIRSMTTHLKNLPESFEGESEEPGQAGDEGTVGQPGGPGVAKGGRPEAAD